MPNKNEQATIDRLMKMDSDVRSNVLLNTTIQGTAQQILDQVENNDIKLKVNKTWVQEKYDNKNISSQKEIRNKGLVWGNDLRADVSLIDKLTGKTIDHVDNLKVATIPKITDRGTFLIHGNEYQFTKQSRLKPGIYTKRQSNGEISSFFNVDKTIDFERGFNNNFKILFDPEKKAFTMNYGSKNVPLINALDALGVDRKKMITSWGKDVYDANDAAYGKFADKNQKKLYEAVIGLKPDAKMHTNDVQMAIRERLFKTKIDPLTTAITIGRPHAEVSEDALLDASKKIIDIHRGDAESDDREAMVFKSFYDIEDHVRDRMVKNSKRITGPMLSKLNKTRSINKSISSQSFDPWTIGVITQNSLSSPPTQTNVMSIIGESTKVTSMGEGGIGTSNAITDEMRQISNTEAGFLDPLHTPEGGNIGIALHTSVDTIKVGNDLYSKFLKPNGEKTLLRPVDTYDMAIAFPDQYDRSGKVPIPKSKNVKAIFKGKMVEVPASKIGAIIADPIGMFDTSANSIPFLDSLQGNRGLTAAKMQEQAVSLKHREAPLFKIVDDRGKDFQEMLAKQIAMPQSPADGEVVSVGDEEIIIKDKDGNNHNVGMYHNFSLNQESFLHNEPLVKVGDKVKAGQSLADNNFTRGGRMALGTNLRVAYMPYKGYNYEDSAIMSESAAKKLTSEHMYDLKARRSAKGVFSREKFRAYYPEELKAKNADKLDKDGVIKIGTRVESGDVVIAHLERKPPTADDLLLGRLSKQLRKDMADEAVRWENDHVGVVTAVQKHGNNIVVNVKTEEPLKIADKISGLHGNKHIISMIVPDEEMPLDPKTGKHIDLTMNPIGVSNRINTSQLLEAAAGKIAEKTGKPYEIHNFADTDNAQKILDDLKANGLSDKDILVDPETNKPFLNPIMTGNSHVLKLEHKVDHKFSARYREGYDSNEQPISGGETGAKNLGRMEMAAMLARGANENLREMFSIKGQRNDEFWKALETGQGLPPPKKAFVWDKMLAMMNGSGINVEQKGKVFSLKPMTDEEILNKSQGELKNPVETFRKKDLAPIKEGLFDPVKAGGVFGNNFTHFKLPEKILNPMTTQAAATLVDMPVKSLEDIITGKKFIDKKTLEIVTPGTPGSFSGGPAVEHMLSKINVKEQLKQARDLAEGTNNPTKLNTLNRKIKYLQALQKNDMKPTDYMIQNVLVIPSKFRPMFTMGTENTVIMSDVNDLYQQAGHTGNAFKELKETLDSSIENEDVKNTLLKGARGAMYQDVKAIYGLQDPTSFIHRTKDKKGLVKQIAGKDQAKTGFFQDKVMERKQDLVGRSTIILNPQLGGDQIGLPREMAEKIFRPFIMQKMVSWGYPALDAQKHATEKSPIFNRALDVVADERLVIANRAPTLHKWNMTAFKPVLTNGKAIEVPSVVISKNFGGDFDGDSENSTLFISLNFNKLYKFLELSKKQVVFGNFCIDSNSNIDYIISILKPMEVHMPIIEKLVVNNEDVVLHSHIKNFPRVEESKRINESNGNEDYDVPDGISIFSIDNISHEFVRVPVTKFSIHKQLVNYSVELSSGDSLLVSSDQSVVALNLSSFEIEKVTPEDLKVGRLVPKLKNMDVTPSVFAVPLVDYSESKSSFGRDTSICKNEMPLNEETGWLIGVMVGNGWISDERQICISTVFDSIGSEFGRIVNSLIGKELRVSTIDLLLAKNI